MKQFQCETDPGRAPEPALVVEVAWRVLQVVKAEVGRRQTPGLTPTQMRALGFLVGSPGASLSELADDLGLRKPTASKVVEELVQEGRVTRGVVRGNRRKLTLHVTPAGLDALETATAPAMARIGELLAPLTAAERETVARALALLHPLVRPAAAHDRGAAAEHAVRHAGERTRRSHVARPKPPTSRTENRPC